MENAYRDMFGADAPASAQAHQDRLHEIAASKQAQAANLRLQALVNRQYEDACLRTYAETGRESALHSAQIHGACAERKIAQADALSATIHNG